MTSVPKTPTIPGPYPNTRALVAAAPERCLWDTDWPHPNTDFMPNDGDLADMLPEWIPDEARRKKVLADNPARFYGF